jgi:hypothetical protein
MLARNYWAFEILSFNFPRGPASGPGFREGLFNTNRNDPDYRGGHDPNYKKNHGRTE